MIPPTPASSSICDAEEGQACCSTYNKPGIIPSIFSVSAPKTATQSPLKNTAITTQKYRKARRTRLLERLRRRAVTCMAVMDEGEHVHLREDVLDGARLVEHRDAVHGGHVGAPPHKEVVHRGLQRHAALAVLHLLPRLALIAPCSHQTKYLYTRIGSEGYDFGYRTGAQY